MNTERDKRPELGGWCPGSYEGVCCKCSKRFIGHKRAIVCADCAYSDCYKYEVYHSDGYKMTGKTPPKFKTWKEATEKQNEWNKEVPGHKARKIK